MLITRDEANELVRGALDQLIEDDIQLIELNLCERAIHFKIAHYMSLSKIIRPPLTLDCEYNRRYGDEKILWLCGKPHPSKVFPDILVHERDSDVNNMIAIEIKRPGQSLARDREKLRAFSTQLGYQHTGHIIIGRNRRGDIIVETQWIDF